MRVESAFVPRAEMLSRLADGWQLADPPECMEKGGEKLFLVVRPKASFLDRLFRRRAA